MKVDDLNDKSFYINRELGWLCFNKRVLEEALDKENPLLERVHFLSIFSSNLDEFFMIRVAGLKDQVKAKFTKGENKTRLTPKEQLRAISKKNHKLVRKQYETLKEEIIPELAREGIKFITFNQLQKEQRNFIENYFVKEIAPKLEPMIVPEDEPLSFFTGKNLHLLGTLDRKKRGFIQFLKDLFNSGNVNKETLGIIRVPSDLKRYVQLPSKEGYFILLEDIIKEFFPQFFKDYQVGKIMEFRITRNADMTIEHDEARDLLKKIERELRLRKRGAPVRLEVKPSFDKVILAHFLERLEMKIGDVYELDGPLDLTFLREFYSDLKKVKPELAFEPYCPRLPKYVKEGYTTFDRVRESDVLFHHPYQSFQPIVDFLTEAATDRAVTEISMTLYRVTEHSPIIEALQLAAQNGKKVTVLIELKARFDEQNNVTVARILQSVGCHVIFGITKLKTHSKIALVVRETDEKVERFVHLGTGNYNEVTANFYTDFSLLTANEEMGIDAKNYFLYLTGEISKPEYLQFSVAPRAIRDQLIKLIDREIEYHKQFGKGRIVAKMNSLTDKVLIKKFFEASIAGVKVDLIIRGTCCLRTGIAGVSENITVRSIVGRFLEHSRIYYFRHNKEEKIYLSSADLMTRNMKNRVEIAFPILQKDLKEQVVKHLDISFQDNVKARELGQDGMYHYVERKIGEPRVNSQMKFCELAYVTEDEK